MQSFVYATKPARVVFGKGSLDHLEREVDLLAVQRVLVLSTPGRAGHAQAMAVRLGARCAGVYSGAAMHVPLEVAHKAREAARQAAADCVLALGGGSTIGLAKAVAMELSIPILAIPSTYAGSEMTPIFGLTENGVKRTGSDERALARTVIYDPVCSLSLPVAQSVASGLNAIAHGAEGMYAQNGNPITTLMAEEGIRALASALPVIFREPANLEARSDALYGAWLCGSVLGGVGMALHHKLCHTLGGSFAMPHAEVHAVILPHALAFNAEAAPDAMMRIARALGAADPMTASVAMFAMAGRLDAPTSLKDLGFRSQDLDQAAELAVQRPYWNPRPIDAQQRGAVRQLLQNAYEGVCPQ